MLPNIKFVQMYAQYFQTRPEIIFCDFFGMTIDKVIGVMQNSRVNR